MFNMIDLSKLNELNYLNKYNSKLDFLYGLNRINIFIGENNSSKSRFIRSLIKEKDICGYSNLISKKFYHNINDTVLSGISILKQFDYGNDYSKLISFENGDYTSFYCNLLDLVNNINAITDGDHKRISKLKTVLDNIKAGIVMSKEDLNYLDIQEIRKIYIPTLRGIEKFSNYFFNLILQSTIDDISMTGTQRKSLIDYIGNSDSIYKNKIEKVYGLDEKLIFTGENLFDDISQKLLGTAADRKSIYDFQEFISQNFYDGNRFEIIPQIKTKEINVRIGELEHELYNLGDGIKQIITILYPIFTRMKTECLFFIEEPEINLHPRYQRKLINILMSSCFNKHQFFITTHSNHIIDSYLNNEYISLYKFVNNKNDTFKIINTTRKDIELLNLLGVNNTSVFLANCTIWVEGISDKILIKKYLDVFIGDDKNYQEDIDYSFVEYGGSSIAHCSFEETDSIDKIHTSGITNRTFLILDNDNDRHLERKEVLKDIFKENCYELEVREIENTLSKSVLDKTFIDDKHPIKIVFDETSYQNKSVYMGEFIDNHYTCKKWSDKTNSSGTGTIRNKLEFAKLVCKNIETKEDLSKEAVRMCEKIKDFIDKSNKQ